jgi:hypothetical protein
MSADLQLITSPTQLHFRGHKESHSRSSSPFLQCTTLSHTCSNDIHRLREEHLNIPSQGIFAASETQRKKDSPPRKYTYQTFFSHERFTHNSCGFSNIVFSLFLFSCHNIETAKE